MIRILFQPFPTFTSPLKGLRMSLIAGLCVFGVLAFFQPFNLHQVEKPMLLQLAFIYSLAATLVTILVVVLMPMWLPHVFDDRHWTVLREIFTYLFLLLLITLANILINTIVYNSKFSFSDFFSMLWMVLAVAILPITIGTMAKQKRLYKKFTEAANEARPLLSSLSTDNDSSNNVLSSTPTELITLVGNNKNERLEISSENLLLITASDNYIEIYFNDNGQLRKSMFRNTLKAAQACLVNYSEFYRSHKAHLVNLKKVIAISGNAQGLKLQVQGLVEPVPVSRNLTTDIREKLKSLR